MKHILFFVMLLCTIALLGCEDCANSNDCAIGEMCTNGECTSETIIDWGDLPEDTENTSHVSDTDSDTSTENDSDTAHNTEGGTDPISIIETDSTEDFAHIKYCSDIILNNGDTPFVSRLDIEPTNGDTIASLNALSRTCDPLNGCMSISAGKTYFLTAYGSDDEEIASTTIGPYSADEKRIVVITVKNGSPELLVLSMDCETNGYDNVVDEIYSY